MRLNSIRAIHVHFIYYAPEFRRSTQQKIGRKSRFFGRWRKYIQQNVLIFTQNEIRCGIRYHIMLFHVVFHSTKRDQSVHTNKKAIILFNFLFISFNEFHCIFWANRNHIMIPFQQYRDTLDVR